MRKQSSYTHHQPSGWQQGFTSSGVAIVVLAGVIAAMVFSFWVLGEGPFYSSKSSQTSDAQIDAARTVRDRGQTETVIKGWVDNYSTPLIGPTNMLQNPASAGHSAQ